MPTATAQRLSAKSIAEDSSISVEKLILKLSMTRGLSEIMDVVRADARRLIGADGVTFVLRDNGKCYYAEEDAISPLWKGQRFPMENCISGWAMLNGEMVIIEDIYTDDRIPHTAYRPTFVRSLVITPVRKEDPVAAIGAYWARQRYPSERELRTLRSIANGAAVAMTNVDLYQSLVKAREEAVEAREAVILAMASLAETRDNDTGNHVRRTQQYVKLLAEEALRRGMFAPELDLRMVNLIYKSAPLHDIGKVGIPDHILLKPGRLDQQERAVMETHAELGRKAIADAARHLGKFTEFFKVAQDIAHTHHERWDGTGYPRRLKGEDIPFAGRMMAIVDVYDALTSERVYKSAMPHAEAVEIIAAESGRHFDPELVKLFLGIAHRFEDIRRFLPDE